MRICEVVITEFPGDSSVSLAVSVSVGGWRKLYASGSRTARENVSFWYMKTDTSPIIMEFVSTAGEKRARETREKS